MDGRVIWTEVGEGQGLDHLSMQTMVEAVYQERLPGLSSVTTRLRNYSFHAWWLTHYATRRRQVSVQAFRHHARAGERLYALAAMQIPGETGTEGSEAALAQLALGGELIDFAPEGNQGGGAFQNIYRGPMVQMGLVAEGEHGLPVPTVAGHAVAAAYAASLGEAAAEAFASAATQGFISRNDLALLKEMGPSRLPLEGEEAGLLRAFFLGIEDVMTPLLDKGLNGAEILRQAAERRATLLAVLQVAAADPQLAVSSDLLRWLWLETPAEGPWAETQKKWQAFQSGDMVRIAYEAILGKIQRFLEDHPAGLSLSVLVDEVSRDVPMTPFGAWLDELSDLGAESLQQAQTRALRKDASLTEMLAPVAWLRAFWEGRQGDAAAAFPVSEGAQTLWTELDWMQRAQQVSAREAISQMLRNKIILRHLEVAARKFRAQRNYTNIVEIEDARLRSVSGFGPAFSGPRLPTAIRFLQDVDLLKNGRITARGRAVLEAAT